MSVEDWAQRENELRDEVVRMSAVTKGDTE